MHTDTERRPAAARSEGVRAHPPGWVTAAATGVYCRPGCPVAGPGEPPHHPSEAAAQAAGLRACERCHPDAGPGPAEWDGRTDLTARAVRLIADGVVDREGPGGLAARLGEEAHEVEGLLRAELGAGPLALARAARDRTARLLLTTSDLSLAEVSRAAGYAGPDELSHALAAGPGFPARRAAAGPRADGPGVLHLRLPFRAPLCPDNLFGHLVATAVPGVEEWRDGAYRRTLRLPHGTGVVALTPHCDHIGCRLRLTDLRDLPTAVARCRRMLDLDADPEEVDGLLARDAALAPLVARAPGRRVPRTVDEEEFAVRAVLGQQVSTAAARTHAARLVLAHGEPVQDPDGGLTHLFPTPAALAGLDPEALAMPRTRRATLTGLVAALASGAVPLDAGADRESARAKLAALPGIGPWTVEMVAMRALGDPDAFPHSDLALRKGASRLGLPAPPSALLRHSEAWRPWRAYAVQHLWATQDHPINHLPAN